MGCLNLMGEKARLEKLSDDELLREINALIQQFSEIQIRLNKAKQVHAARKEKAIQQNIVDTKIPKQSRKLTFQRDNADLRNSMIKKEKYLEKNTCTDYVHIKGFSYNDPSVPAGWGIKFRSQGPKYPPKMSYCDPLGIIFMSKKEAYEYMLKSGEYRKDDIALMKIMRKNPSKTRDEIVPLKGKESNDNLADSEVDKVKTSIIRPGYIYTEPSLPKGWGMKVTSTNAWTKKSVCNPEGKVFTSKRQAYLFALASGSHLEQDINLLKSPFSEAVPLKLENVNIIRDNVRLNNFNYDDDTLPEYWGSRRIFQKGRPNMILICTPEGRQFTSKVKAFEHMVSMGNFYDTADVHKIMKNLKEQDIEKVLKRFDSSVDE